MLQIKSIDDVDFKSNVLSPDKSKWLMMTSQQNFLYPMNTSHN